MCVDYRNLNSRTVKDYFALPKIEEILDVLKESKHDRYEVWISPGGDKETHKERTAFNVGLLGLYEYIRMPFGLSNSPTTYQQLMKNASVIIT